MSDEQKKEEQEVEGHMRRRANDEPTDEAEVEGHVKRWASDEPTDEAEGEVEAHVRVSNARADSPRES